MLTKANSRFCLAPSCCYTDARAACKVQHVTCQACMQRAAEPLRSRAVLGTLSRSPVLLLAVLAIVHLYGLRSTKEAGLERPSRELWAAGGRKQSNVVMGAGGERASTQLVTQASISQSLPLATGSASSSSRKRGAGSSSSSREPPASKAIAAPDLQPGTKSKGDGEALTQNTVYVALCLPAKDEHPNIREWMAYHRSIGVGRVYVYDDCSQPPMREVLGDFIQSGLVVYRLLDGPLGPPGSFQQMAIYDDCIRSFGSQSTWIGTIDADEFLFIMDGSPDLPSVLRRYEEYGGLVVNWRLFGSGHATRPKEGVLASYTKCTRPSYHENTHVRSIVNTRHVFSAGWSPHHFEYQSGYYAVNSNFTRVDGPFSSPPDHSVLTVNHYALRSAQDFQKKMARGTALGPAFTKNQEFWDKLEKRSKDTCMYATSVGAQIQEELAALVAGGGAAAAAAAAAVTAVVEQDQGSSRRL